MADADRLVAALRYQEELDAAQRPATVNPLMAAKFARQRENLTQPTSVMDERYPAWKKSQDDADKFLLGADVLGAAVPFAGPAVRMGVAGAKSLAPQAAGMAEGYMARTGMMQPVMGYHGSPHLFPPTKNNPLGEFDASKVGTGEGAQAYGHGAAYLAEAKDVAKQYSATSPFRGAKAAELPAAAWDELGPIMQRRAIPGDMIPGKDETTAVRNMLLEFGDKLTPQERAVFVKWGGGEPYLYKADIPDEQVAKMLDWDKPLSQQPEILAKIQGIKNKTWVGDPSSLTGGELVKLFYKDTSALREVGIPGIKYLDAGSRGAGSGTRNFVVFDQKHAKIIGRE